MRLRPGSLAGIVALGMVLTLHVSVAPKAQTSPVGSQSSTIGEAIKFIRECLEEKRVAEAQEAADRFAREQANNPDALLQLASLLASHSQHDRAAALFARVNQLRPHSPNVLYNLGAAYYHLKRLDAAAKALAESADLDERPPETHFALALIAIELGDHENAILELQHAIKRAPGHADYYALLGQEFSKVGYWTGAADAYRHVAAIEPTQPLHFLHLGDALFRVQDLKGAIEAFKKAEALDPHIPEINYLIAFAFENDSQRDQAREYYQRQLTLSPDHLPSLLGAATVDLDEGRFADAEKYLQSILARDPDHVQARYELGLLWFKTHQYDRAIEAFHQALRLRPDHTQAEYYLYLAFSRMHQNAAAETALTQWKKLEALDRKVRSQEVAYEAARKARWESGAASGH